MSAKKRVTGSGSRPALKIGSRVRCTEDGVVGRIVWANGVSAKIKWDDGEQVTWNRDSLSDRPIEFLDADDRSDAEPHAEQPPTPVATEEATAQEETPVPTPEPGTEASPSEPAADVPISDSSPTETTVEPVARPETAVSETASVAAPAADQTPTGPKPRRKVKKSETASGSEQKLSALDAAAKVLAEAGTAMTCQEMIEAMATKGYWVSPGGKTPAATLYSAIAREINTKGGNSRFQKVDRGKFAGTAGA
jgi:hypothetical protein